MEDKFGNFYIFYKMQYYIKYSKEKNGAQCLKQYIYHVRKKSHFPLYREAIKMKFGSIGSKIRGLRKG